MEVEVEVETNLILSKKIKLRLVNGEMIAAVLRVYECEDPYVLVFTILTDDNEDLRMDVFKEDLARELKIWLEGKYIRNPSVLVPVRIDEAIMKFIKFAKTPKQEDLIMWILSRSELYPRTKQRYEREIVFGGKSELDEDMESEERFMSMRSSIENNLQKTSTIAAAASSIDDYNYSLHNETKNSSSIRPKSANQNQFQMTAGQTKLRAHSAGKVRRSTGDDLGMFEMTKQLLGKSQTLESLKQSRVKGREGAKTVLKTTNWSDDHWRLCQEIERARKDIEQRMDERRRMIEIAKTRQVQSAEKFRTIREQLKEKRGGNQFLVQAEQELMTLLKIEEDIKEDIMKQKNRVQRGAQKIGWTMAPAGFQDRRGKSRRGPVLGPGPLPPKATSQLRDPKLDSTMQKFYWDSDGRRHSKSLLDDEESEESLVEQAMEAIRRAAANISSFKLDLKAVFEEFDTSGDGFLSPEEMAQAFLSMGVKLDLPTMQIIFQHFDPNGSGSVHFGEFVWAFFNRRGLVRQWKRKTTGLTAKQVVAKFHSADTNGNGRLNPKEFKKLLKSFQIDISEKDIEILINRFDVDNDGEIDMYEFKDFIDQELGLITQSQVITNPMDKLKLITGTAGSGTKVYPRSRSGSPTTELMQTAPGQLESYGMQPQKSTKGPRRPSPQTDLRSISRESIPEVEHEDDEDDEVAEHMYSESIKGGPSYSKFDKEHHYEDYQGQDERLDESVDVMWMSRMLQAQAEVESRIGRKYYRNL